MELVRQNYRDFGPTLASEALLERHGIAASRETLRKWMVGPGLWLSRKQRRTFQQPRLRRESYGELVQIDGSEHRWFESRGEPCTLLVFIEDATSKLMQLRFVPSESTASYFETLRGYLDAHGIYPLNVMRWFTGEEPKSYRGLAATRDKSAAFATVEQSIDWTVEFPSGILGAGGSSYEQSGTNFLAITEQLAISGWSLPSSTAMPS